MSRHKEYRSRLVNSKSVTSEVHEVFDRAQDAWAEEAVMVIQEIRNEKKFVRGGPWRALKLSEAAEEHIQNLMVPLRHVAHRDLARQVLMDYVGRLHFNDALHAHLQGRGYKEDVGQ